MIVFPAVAPGDPLNISASLYTTYLRCPTNALAMARGEYGPESRAAFSGMLAHRIFARHLESGAISAEGFPTACRQEIGLAMNPKLGSLALRPSEVRSVISQVGALYEKFQTIATEGCKSVEEDLEVVVAGNVTLRGRIDAVFDDPRGVRLVDWKTGSLAGAEEQLAFYAMLWALQRGELPAIVEAASVGSGERFESTPGVASVVETAQQVARMVDTLRGGFVDEATVMRTGGPGCRYCPLLDGCAEGAAALRVLSA